MANREEWCADKLSKLLHEDLRISTLNEIRDHFAAVSQEEASRTARLLQLPLVFDCLNDSNTEQIDLACEVLSLCMSSMSLGESTALYSSALERALNHPSPSVKLMALKEIKRNVSDKAVLNQISSMSSLFVGMAKCIGGEDLSVANAAADIICEVGKSPAGMKQLVSTPVISSLNNACQVNDTIRFRVYDVMVRLSCTTKDNFETILTTHFIQRLVRDLGNDDIMLRLNVLELLSNFAAARHCVEYLDSHNVMQSLSRDLANCSEDALASLLIPGLLKFFGNVAYFRPKEVYSKYQVFFDVLFENIKSLNDSILNVSLDTLGHIARTTEGKFVLESYRSGSAMEDVLKMFGSRMKTLPTPLKIRTLNCFESLISTSEADQNSQVCDLCRKWFRSLSAKPTDLVVEQAQNPFEEIRLAGLAVLCGMSVQRWGQEAIRDAAGLIEFLMNRSGESLKTAKELKFAVVRNLSRSSVFDKSVSQRMQQFVKQGPFYVETVTEVAIEGL